MTMTLQAPQSPLYVITGARFTYNGRKYWRGEVVPSDTFSWHQIDDFVDARLIAPVHADITTTDVDGLRFINDDWALGYVQATSQPSDDVTPEIVPEEAASPPAAEEDEVLQEEAEDQEAVDDEVVPDEVLPPVQPKSSRRAKH